MRQTYTFILTVLLALCAGGVSAEEPKPNAGKPEVAKPADLDVSLKGIVGLKPKDAAENVVATFVIIPKKFDIVDERKTVNLFAKGEVVKKLLEFAGNRTKAEITGTMADGGILVTAVESYSGKKKNHAELEKQEKPTVAQPGQPGKTEPTKTSKPSDSEF